MMQIGTTKHNTGINPRIGHPVGDALTSNTMPKNVKPPRKHYTLTIKTMSKSKLMQSLNLIDYGELTS